MKLSIREAAQKLKVETHVLRFWEEELGLLIPRNELGHRCYGENELELLEDIQMLKEKGFSLRAVKILLPETELVNQLDDFGLDILKEELEKRFREEDEADGIPKITVQPVHNGTEGRKDRNAAADKDAGEGWKAGNAAANKDAGEGWKAGNAAADKDAGEGWKAGNAAANRDVGKGRKAGNAAADKNAGKDRKAELDSAARHKETGVSDEKIIKFMEILRKNFEGLLEENNQFLLESFEEEKRQTMEMQQKLSEGILKEMDYRLRMQEEQQEQYFRKLDEVIRNHQNAGRQAAAALAPKRRGIFGKKA